MRLAFASLVAAAVLATASSSARADGYYFTEALGGARVSDELSSHLGDGGFAARLALGMRRGSWAVEGWFGAVTRLGAGNAPVDPQQQQQRRHDGDGPGELLMYGVDVKYIKPLAKPLEIYLRGGLSHGQTSGVLDGYEGRGFGVGAGIQLKGKVSALGFLAWPLFFTKVGPKVTGALFIENGIDFHRLHRNGNIRDGRGAVDAVTSRLQIGFAFGSDF